MKILITGGGTEVDIDDVRSIKNFSKGTTASLMVKYCLELGHQVDYIISKEGKNPFQLMIDTKKPRYGNCHLEVDKHIEWCQKYSDKCMVKRYRTYNEYLDLVMEALKQREYDVIILAAAVSDFGVDKQEGKNSKLDCLNLHPLDKVISYVQGLKRPDCFLVGFKLLSDATDIELAVEAYKSILNNDCDMVVANDFKELGERRVLCFHKDLKVTDSRYQDKNVSEFIVDEIIKKVNK